MLLYRLIKAMTFAAVVLFATSAGASIVIDWNNAALEEVRLSTALRNGPPMVARALAIVHTCMYDAWAAYDDIAVGTTDINGTRRRPSNERTDVHKAIAVPRAISFAAYRCLRNLYPDDGSSKVPPPSTGLGPSPSARLGTLLTDPIVGLGYDPNDMVNMDPQTPAGIGNIAAARGFGFAESQMGEDSSRAAAEDCAAGDSHDPVRRGN